MEVIADAKNIIYVVTSIKRKGKNFFRIYEDRKNKKREKKFSVKKKNKKKS